MNARDTYIKQMREQLDEWSEELDRLETRLRQDEANRGVGYRDDMSRLRQNREEMGRNITEIQEASENAWEDLKAGADETWNRMKDDFKRVRSQSA